MSHKNLIEQEVLHEIAMSIGASLDLNQMLRECLPVFVRGLGCCTAAILLKDADCDFFTPKMILPHAAMRNQDLHKAMAVAIEQTVAGIPLSVPLNMADSHYFYYAWPLPEPGFELEGENGEIMACAELGWEELKIAFLLDNEKAYQPRFTAFGWKTVSISEVLADSQKFMSMKDTYGKDA